MNGLKYVLLMNEIPLKEIASELHVSPQLVTAWCQNKKPIAKTYLGILGEKFGVDAHLLPKELTLIDKIHIESQLHPDDAFAFDVAEFHKLKKQNQVLKQKHTKLLDVLYETDQALQETQMKLAQIQQIIGENHHS